MLFVYFGSIVIFTFQEYFQVALICLVQDFLPFLFLVQTQNTDLISLFMYLCRFRSRLTDVYGVGTKKRPIVYSGRGRPPKKAMMPTDLSEGAASPLPKGSPAAAAGASGEGGAAASPGGGATGPEVGVAGDSSDEGGEEEDVVERVYDGEYSEEDTDEEVWVL